MKPFSIYGKPWVQQPYKQNKNIQTYLYNDLIVLKLLILAQQDLLICKHSKRVASGLNLSSQSRFQGYICKGSMENDPKHLQILTKLNTTLYIVYYVMANGGFNLSQQVEMLILHYKNYNYVKRRKRRPRPSYITRKFTCRN